MPEAAAPVGDSSNGDTMPEADAPAPLYNDAPGHVHRPQIHHRDHHQQQKMPQAGMHGAGIAMAAQERGGMKVVG